MKKVIFVKFFMFYIRLCLFAADSWPQRFDDSNARRDWGWSHDMDIDDLCRAMFDYLTPIYQENNSQQMTNQQTV